MLYSARLWRVVPCVRNVPPSDYCPLTLRFSRLKDFISLLHTLTRLKPSFPNSLRFLTGRRLASAARMCVEATSCHDTRHTGDPHGS